MRLPWETSDLHPHALSLTEDAIGADFADALKADLAALDPPSMIQRFRCVAPQGDHDAALIDAGFHAVRLTRIVDLPVADHPLLLPELPPEIAAHWFRLDERGPWGGWLDAHWRHYQITHHINPPRLPPSGARGVFVANDLVEALALRDGPQGRVRAFASLRKNDEIGWIGGAPDLLPVTLAACLRRAAAQGWSKATVEVDDDDTNLWALIDASGITPAQTYLTWQLERDPARRPS